jgi:hypothetical protein
LDVYFDGPREARRFTEFIHGPRMRGVDTYVANKERARRVALACGVRVPELLASFAGPQSVSLSSLPDRFVLKPVNLSSRRGVHLLTRRAATEWFDAFTHKLWTEDRLKHSLALDLARQKRAPNSTILAEE